MPRRIQHGRTCMHSRGGNTRNGSRKRRRWSKQRGLDVLVVNSNEADYANVRYFSNFWPLFETAGVAISPSGKAALMVGPESGKYAADRSMIQNIFQLMEYRESADPAYPEVKASKYTDVFHSHRRQGQEAEDRRRRIPGQQSHSVGRAEGVLSRSARSSAPTTSWSPCAASSRKTRSPASAKGCGSPKSPRRKSSATSGPA